MVFGGRPSRGCYNCIGRRIKCDGNLTGCAQCRRVRVVCPGYRNELDLKFQDQTRAVAAKVHTRHNRKKTSSKKPSRALTSLESAWTPPECQIADRNVKVSCSDTINPSLEDEALAIFFSQQVCGRFGTFEYLRGSDILNNMSSHIESAIRAIGLISLSKTHSSAVIETQAIQAYSVAIRLISDRLNSSAATDDDTLLAVLLLDQYDTIAENAACGNKTATAHLTGAIAISKMKGLQQFQSSLGTRLFRHMASRNLVNTAKEGRMIPIDIIALHTFMAQNASKETERPTWAMSSILSRVVNLNAEVRSGRFRAVDEIIPRFLELDREYEALLHDMPGSFAYEVLHASTTDTARPSYEERCQIHTDFRVALIWNIIPASRILLNEALLRQIRQGHLSGLDNEDVTLETQYIVQRSTDTINEMILDICATVPQQVGSLGSWLESHSGKVPLPQAGLCARALALEKAQSTSNILEFQGSAYSLLWPLYVIGRCSDHGFHGLSEWVIETMRFIGDKFDISQSSTLTSSLRSRDPIIPV